MFGGNLFDEKILIADLKYNSIDILSIELTRADF